MAGKQSELFLNHLLIVTLLSFSWFAMKLSVFTCLVVMLHSIRFVMGCYAT